MDPFTALGLASDVIQFVNFVWNLVSETRRIAQSGDGLKSDHRVLEAIVADVQQYAAAISPTTDSSPQLKKLAKECSSIAAELLSALEKLKLKGHKTHWESFPTALKQVWKQSKIDKLSTRLFKAQSQMASHIQLIMVNNVSDLNKTVRKLCENNDKLNVETQHDLRKLTSNIVLTTDEVKSNNARFREYTEILRRSEAVRTSTAEGILSQLRQLSQSLSELRDSDTRIASQCDTFLGNMENYIEMLQHAQAVPADLSSKILHCMQQFQVEMRDSKVQEADRKLQDKMLTGIQDPTSELKTWEASLRQEAREISQQLQFLSGSLQDLEQEGHNLLLCQAFLKRLHYTDITRRNGNIQNAHLSTFAWIFSEPKKEAGKNQSHHRFVQWLRRENHPFWIQGKPGSGKSTLMKFIVDHPETLRHLRYWAADKELIVASFYFWIAGTQLQKSQEGLLRSLLFQIFRKCPELVLSVREKHKLRGDFEGLDIPWSLDELLEMYRTVLGSNIRKRFCFFIDGLDEFQGSENGHRDLIETLRDLDKSSDIKLCLSSRPWMLFEDEYGGDEMFYFRLQDLTKDDIHQVVSDRFKAHPQLIKLQKSGNPNPEIEKYHNMMDQIVNRSQGVFLWVHLVLRSLLDGLTFGDSVKTLQSRLEAFPEDLDGFFQHMLDSIPKIYQPRAARMFRIALSTFDSMFLLFYSLLQDLEEHGAVIIDEPMYGMSSTEMERRKHGMRRMLDGWSRGLLEVESDSNQVSAYFQDRVGFLHRTARDFLETSGAPFLRQESHCSEVERHVMSCKAFLAMMRRAPVEPGIPDIGPPLLYRFFRFYDKASRHPGTLDELNGLIDCVDNTFVELCQTRHQELQIADASRMVINFACCFGATSWVEGKLSRARHPSELISAGDPALGHALGQSYPSAVTVRLLLRYGADPNQPRVDALHQRMDLTPWAQLIQQISRTYQYEDPGRDKKTDFEIVRCLLLAGASLDHEVTDRNNNRTTARAVIKQCFPEPQATALLSCRLTRTRMMISILRRR